MARILLVEDEPQMRLGLEKNLIFEGYEVETSEDGEVGLEKILTNCFDLVLLDVMLPKINGFDVCKKAREKGSGTPIIMLTAKGEEIDKVLGLELGADDYITKPFGLRELLARIKSVLRRTGETSSGKTESQGVEIGKIVVDFPAYTAYSNGEMLQMTHREFSVLKYLYENKNKIVSREELLNNVWGEDEIITPRTIDNFILKLRQKIEENHAHPTIILTVHKVGYKLVQ